MATTQSNSYSISPMSFNDTTGSTVTKKEELSQYPNLSSVMLIAGLLINPITDIPTYATQSYSIYSHYAQTGQQNEIDFEEGITDLINSYKNYPANWDGYDGIPPLSETVNNTLEFIEKLPFNAKEPRPGVSGDGEISLFWESDDIFVDIGFLGDEKYTFYARDDQAIEYFKDDLDLKDPIPEALLNLITLK